MRCPGLWADDTHCQKTQGKRPFKALLQPLPIVNIPFECLGMEAVSPV